MGRCTMSWMAPSIFQTSCKEAAITMFIPIVAIEAAPIKEEAYSPIEVSEEISPDLNY